MRLTTRTNIAMRALMYCAVNGGRTVRKSDIASACNTSENHMAQVINTLAHHGLVKTTRGRNGGLTLKRTPEDITVGEVFRHLESGVPFAECFDPATNTCPISCCCLLKGALQRALAEFYATLDGVTLADLVAGNRDLEEALALAS
ncbi:Rrf2 family transcriptional regulator [Rhodovulum sp. BSW8]|uniref:Rrf2 family transcriptional regulator n=1 Tax=Rhodovulum visakhapatnamense TaxID=364297 RepID=A0A4R8FVS5_9RHOB|nr:MULTISPECIES: Rrf2 family transcriptional regulator [Rhodovulum]OLS46305.1 Rrf2 family transcriptional regulator [Rhodovulum sulfidophilum]MBL3567962.1 Rrf2 family transcriptional regulator [Rhodovulum visakhapatnamense]MBL3579003.1 Rrf2 family transcriptional regulator [Rhodovulum visakhapatnamense]RBO51730.1 Rrf2 family transcriptional regulator [Rhodovulum sp. BSW8]TDX30637.1 BadM/Rrf2 family transcriptional regulator [Rhodovulum visakhapatnamense]